MPQKQNLREYRQKRDFRSTSEPAGKSKSARKEGSRFVVQQHDASNMHYDFRLEIDGVLKSWAIPKGPSVNPKDKRLAMPTEDHPLDYLDFEGVIPEDEYGAGTVLVWDIGSYENTTEHDGNSVSARKALDEGHLSVELHGKKLKGAFALTRIATGKDEKWILVKKHDKHADARRKPTSSQKESATTGRTLKQVAADNSPKEGQ